MKIYKKADKSTSAGIKAIEVTDIRMNAHKTLATNLALN